MSALEKITISLPAEMVAEIKTAIADGEAALHRLRAKYAARAAENRR